MDKKIIEERLQTLTNNVRAEHFKLEDIIDMLPLDHSYEETEKMVQSYGLSMDDFHYTFTSIFQYRFYRDVTIVDMFGLTKEEIEKQELSKKAEHQKKYAMISLEENDFDTFISVLDKRLKLDAFKVFYEDIPSGQRYDIFREMYARLEYGFANEKDFLESCFKDRFSSQKWNEAMLKLWLNSSSKSSISIYRGEGTKSTPYEDAFSWTLDKKVAEFFANRFDANGVVYKASVKFDDVIDYIEHRNEQEILVKAEDLNSITRVI